MAREITYEPMLEPYICAWARQISTITGSALLFTAIFLFIQHQRERHSEPEHLTASAIWLILTLTFETLMGLYIKRLPMEEIMST